MFGSSHRKIARLAFVGLLGLCLSTYSFILFAILVFFLVKLDHPPSVDDRRKLDGKRLCIGWVTILIFLLIFVPNPIS
jgi:hypothetical protein